VVVSLNIAGFFRWSQQLQLQRPIACWSSYTIVLLLGISGAAFLEYPAKMIVIVTAASITALGDYWPDFLDTDDLTDYWMAAEGIYASYANAVLALAVGAAGRAKFSEAMILAVPAVSIQLAILLQAMLQARRSRTRAKRAIGPLPNQGGAISMRRLAGLLALLLLCIYQSRRRRL